MGSRRFNMLIFLEGKILIWNQSEDFLTILVDIALASLEHFIFQSKKPPGGKSCEWFVWLPCKWSIKAE